MKYSLLYPKGRPRKVRYALKSFSRVALPFAMRNAPQISQLSQRPNRRNRANDAGRSIGLLALRRKQEVRLLHRLRRWNLPLVQSEETAR
jgi:hypothetical protein